MPGSSEVARRVRVRPLYAGLVLFVVLALGGWLWLHPTTTAQFSYRGRAIQLPLPIWSTRVAVDEGSARYIGLGDPSFGGPLGEFEYVEQLGSGHLLIADDTQLFIITRKRTRWFTEILLRVEPRER